MSQSLCWPRTCYVAQVGFKLIKISLSLPPWFWSKGTHHYSWPFFFLIFLKQDLELSILLPQFLKLGIINMYHHIQPVLVPFELENGYYVLGIQWWWWGLVLRGCRVGNGSPRAEAAPWRGQRWVWRGGDGAPHDGSPFPQALSSP